MNRIFVSCGQYTEREKALGKAIVKIVKSVTGLDAFFAEEVQDLNGLDANILAALRECAGFITVLHPRGEINRPNGSKHIRASVWIEQEIAIATYIQRVEKRPLPVIAFIHESVGREGIRELLHLNPIPFNDESEILSALPEQLARWRNLTPSDIRIQLGADNKTREQDHWIRRLVVSLVNDTSERISAFNCEVRLPVGILKHWTEGYMTEAKSDDPRFRTFRFDENLRHVIIPPRTTAELITFRYCVECAIAYTGEDQLIGGALVSELPIEAKIWIDGREYKVVKSIKELSQEISRNER